MVNSNILRQTIKNNGIKMKFVAEKLGISPNSLTRKINNQTEFKLSEIEKLSVILTLTEADKTALFFAPFVEK